MTPFLDVSRRLIRVVQLTERPRARAAVSFGAIIAAIFLALLVVATPDGPAQGGFLEELFGFQPAPSAPRSYFRVEGPAWSHGARRYRHAGRYSFSRSRVALHRRGWRVGARAHDAAEGGASGRAVCVRSCDGFFFPVVNASLRRGGSRQETCGRICPDAEAKLFFMPAGSENITDAKAEDGELYAHFVAKITARADKPKSCSCHVIADDAVESRAVMNDPTLRPGDTVVTAEGVKVFAGGEAPYRKSSFLSLAESPNLSPSKRGALAAIDRAIKTPVGRAVVLNPDRRRHHHERRADAGADQRAN
ncbi:MAG TPA: DUF2865 domain-containing protein [Methylocystis sp.]|nr:DUF2865 domain-containing protein [Methylocystis sp.]